MEDDNKLLPNLSQNLLEILKDEEYYDVTIEVGNDPYVKVFRAHMVILHYRSSYLRRILSTNKKKSDGTLTYIKLSNISPEIFQIILRYIYGGKLSLKDYDNSDIIKVLVAAGELSLQELVVYLQSFLIEYKASWMENNFNFVYQTSFENDLFSELQNYCINLVSKEPDKILKSPNFSSIPEKLLISIIQNDNLQMNEIQIWEHVLKWGLAQNPELPSEITNFSKDDFNTLKNILQQCFPFIRFYNLTSKEFVDKVFPYRKILPEELCADLLKTFLNLLEPDSKPSNISRPRMTREIKLITVDSKIITFQHAELILKWVNSLEITDKLTSSYEFKLLFRASRDGRSNRFHQTCNNKPCTVTIVKVRDSSEILGGYNPIEWKSDDKYGTTKDSFIFSFNNDKIENYILSRVANENHAIYNSSLHGPTFGVTDIYIWPIIGNNYCKEADYEKPIRNTTDSFNVEELEVFQIV